MKIILRVRSFRVVRIAERSALMPLFGDSTVTAVYRRESARELHLDMVRAEPKRIDINHPPLRGKEAKVFYPH